MFPSVLRFSEGCEGAGSFGKQTGNCLFSARSFVVRRFRKIAKSDFCFVMYVRPSVPPSVWNNSAPTGRIFMKFRI
jgi:hypothetical protein